MSLFTIYNAKTSQYTIAEYMDRYGKEEFGFPKWQRYDKWTLSFKTALILSILQNKGIPKIFTYQNKDAENKEYILDGGHRTRAIYGFMNNQFSIQLCDGNRYMWKLNETQSKTRKDNVNKNKSLELPSHIKEIFLKRKLELTTYHDISEADARVIFNELNNQRPMTSCEVINAWSSELVDNIRLLAETPYRNELSYVHYMKRLIKGMKVDHHEYMKTVVGMFSMIERSKNSSGDIFHYCEPKNALTYIQASNDENLNTQFSGEEMRVLWTNFMNTFEKFCQFIETLRTYMGDMNYQPLSGEANTMFYLCYKTEDDININIIGDFIMNAYSYKKQMDQLNRKEKKSTSQIKLQVAQKRCQLDEETSIHIKEWNDTTQNNSNGYINLRKRESILKEILK